MYLIHDINISRFNKYDTCVIHSSIGKIGITFHFIQNYITSTTGATLSFKKLTKKQISILYDTTIKYLNW